MLFHYRLDNLKLIVGIVYRKVGLIAHTKFLYILSQYSDTGTVERCRPYTVNICAHIFKTFLKLCRRLIRKGQCKDIPRIVAVLLFQQVSDFISQYARLPRTCTGYHQRRTVIISHCSTLTLVQFIYIIGIHNSIIKTMWIFNKPLALKFVLNTKV